MTDWAPESWQGRAAAQQPTYPDQQALRTTVDQIRALPPLVTSWEIEQLKG